MEYVRGTTLSQFLESKTSVDSNLAVKFTLQILSALSFAHSRKTWHRDIKPDNILVTKDEVAKILDFGIAKILTRKGLTAAGDILGTPEYMAPEQMLDEVSDHRCDIYATGVMLYQVLTKRLPFEGENPVAILYKKINEDPVPLSYYNRHIGPELNDIVVKALSKDKGERWHNAKTFSEALEAMRSATPAQKPSHTGKQTDLTEFYLNIHPTTVGDAQDNLKAAFVGREKELRRLTHRLRQISNGQGYTVILKGEAGVGKSTLANQFEKYAEQNQAWVLSGVCLYQQGLNAYLPFLDALRRFFGRTSSDIPSKEVAELRKRILEEVPLLYELTELSTTDASSMVINSSANNNSSAKKLFESWYHLITLISSIRPLVLIIDDLHMADEASLRLFHYLSHHVSDKSLLLLGISRAERYDLHKDGKPTLTAEMLSRINSESSIEQITIYRLCKESCDALIDRSLSPSLFTEAFYDSIYNETKGNPLFVRETLELLRSKQVIFLKDGVWHNAQGSLEIDVPQKVEDIFVQRVSALNDDEREILQLASVIGHKFRASQLSPLLQLPTIKLLKILQRIEAGLQIIASTETGFIFEHPLLRDMLYNDLAFALRREYHAMIACDMKEFYQGNYGDKIAEVALHLRNSGQHAEAAPLLYQAAQRNFALGLFHDAIRLINDYLDTAEQSGEAKGKSIIQLDLYCKLGKCYEQTGRLDKSLKAYQKLLELSANKKETAAELEALTCVGRVQIRLGDYETAISTYNSCIEIAESKDISSGAGKAYNNLGVLYFNKGDLEKARHYFEKSIQAKENEESEYSKGYTLMNLGIIAALHADYDLALDYYQQSLKIYLSEGSKENEAQIYTNMGITYGYKGEWQRAINTFEQGLKLTDDSEDQMLRGVLYLNLGNAHAQIQIHLEAEKNAKKALKMFKLMGDTRRVADTYHVFGLIHATKGSLDEAKLFLNESLRLNEQEENFESIGQTCESYANMYRKSGDTENAKKYYERAIETYNKLNLQVRIEKLKGVIDELNSNSEDPTPINIINDCTQAKKQAAQKCENI